MKTAKQEYLDNEADAWFERNLVFFEEKGPSLGCRFFADFFKRFKECNANVHSRSVLEIGSSFGYNLAWLAEQFQDFQCSGIEPSRKAIDYGSKKYVNLMQDGRLILARGTADDMPFADGSFDIILIGFCLYQADRSLIGKIISEIDRCLRNGGFLVVTDFDVFSGIKRVNMHNVITPTYKLNYARLFEGLYGYSLVEKTTYDADATDMRSFPRDMNNRVSTQILYKENEEDVYLTK